MEQALALPEIRSTIGRFLCIQDLVTCLFISKTWYETLLPWVWRSFQLPKDERQIAFSVLSQLLLRNGPHIRRLLVTRVPRSVDILENCNQLQSLECKGRLVDDSDFNPMVQCLVQKNRTSLRRFVQGFGVRLSTENLIQTLDCPNLDWVEIRVVDLVDSKLWASLTRLCTRVRRLAINYIQLPEDSIIPWTTDITFPSLEHLTALGADQKLALEVANRCPNLRFFHIHATESSIRQLVEVVIPCCPMLRVLILEDCRPIKTKDMIQVLNALPPMRSIQYDCALTTHHTLYPLYRTALQRHFDTIQEITLSHQWRLISPLAILHSCPNLRALTGGTIDCEALMSPLPWICSGLRLFRASLQIRIVAFTSKFIIRTFYSRLAQLHQLEILDLSVSAKDLGVSWSIPWTGSWLRLGQGLEMLKPLKKLQQCSFVNCPLSMEPEDVEWIRMNWPNFWGMRGRLHENPTQNERLWKLFEKYGIRQSIICSRSLDFVDL